MKGGKKLIDGPPPPQNDTIVLFFFLGVCWVVSFFFIRVHSVASPFFSLVLFIHGALRIVSRLLLLFFKEVEYFISLSLSPFIFNFSLSVERKKTHTET